MSESEQSDVDEVIVWRIAFGNNSVLGEENCGTGLSVFVSELRTKSVHSPTQT